MQYSFDEKNHLHSLDGKPLFRTSTVCKVIAKPLTWWASGLAVMKFGWLNPKKNTPAKVKAALSKGYKKVTKLKPKAYALLLEEAYRAHSVRLEESAEAGTDLHAELEWFVKSQMGLKPAKEFDPKIQPFIDWSKTNVKKFLWAEAHCFDEETWTGGITDAGAEMNDGTINIFDFKSSTEAYKSQAIQGGGYAIQIEKNGLWDSQGLKNKKLDKPIDGIYIVPFGAKIVKPVLFADCQAYKDGFKAAVVLHKLLNFE